MLAWLKGAKSTKERYELSPVFASADRSVSETLKQSGSASRKRKRSGNNSYSAEQRAQIADYARQNGNTAAARHFSIKWNMDISESSVRGMKKDLVKRLSLEEIDKVVELPIKTCGRPTLLGVHEEDVHQYITNLRENGGIVNSSITSAK